MTWMHGNLRLLARFLGVLFVLSAAVRPAAASADGEFDVRVISVDDRSFPQMVVVLAVESGGRPLAEILPSEVSVTDNGQPTRVLGVQRVQDAAVETTVVVTLDTSGSMAGASIARAKEALLGLTGRLPATDNVALVSFSDRPSVVIAPTANKAVVSDAVAGLQAAGNTALYGAVAESARVAATAETPRKLVVLLTDGEEFGNVSGIAREASLERAVASGAIFYVIGLGVGADRDYLTQLATRTGGRYLEAPTSADIDRGYTAIEETLRGQFAVTLESLAPAEPLARDLVVRVARGGLNGTAEFKFQSTRVLPLPTEPAATPEAAVQPPEVVPTATEPEDSGGGVTPAVWLIGLLAAGAAVAAVVWRRRTAGSTPVPAFSEQAIPDGLPAVVHSPAERPEYVARLVRGGSPADSEAPETLLVPMQPVTIGWSPECELRLPRIDGLAAVHARLWWRDGNVMLHDLAGATMVNGAVVRWASLADSDSLTFGPFTYEFSTLVPQE